MSGFLHLKIPRTCCMKRARPVKPFVPRFCDHLWSAGCIYDKKQETVCNAAELFCFEPIKQEKLVIFPPHRLFHLTLAHPPDPPLLTSPNVPTTHHP